MLTLATKVSSALSSLGARLIATDIRFPAATLPVWVAFWFRPFRTSPVIAARVECGWAVPAA
ncbi:hypothetical protein HEP87_57280 [Streptomyces sp. S1D4-11]